MNIKKLEPGPIEILDVHRLSLGDVVKVDYKSDRGGVDIESTAVGPVSLIEKTSEVTIVELGSNRSARYVLDIWESDSPKFTLLESKRPLPTEPGTVIEVTELRGERREDGKPWRLMRKDNSRPLTSAWFSDLLADGWGLHDDEHIGDDWRELEVQESTEPRLIQNEEEWLDAPHKTTVISAHNNVYMRSLSCDPLESTLHYSSEGLYPMYNGAYPLTVVRWGTKL